MPEPSEAEPAPRCPRCGAPLEIRKWRKFPRTGRLFWGCSRYRERKCSYTRDLAPGEKPPPKLPPGGGESRPPAEAPDLAGG